jgi:hypothetical protein
VSEVQTALPQQNRLRIKITLDPKYPLSLREIRERLKHIAPEAIERFRPGRADHAAPATGSVDESLLGVPVRLLAPAESLPGFQLPQHEVFFIWPQSALPSALSEGLTNVAEANAVIKIAVDAAEERFIITSPFAAQCRCIASMIAEKRIENVQILSPDKLGHRRIQPPRRLIVSMAASDTATAACWPLNDLGQLTPLFIGNWSLITIVCTPAIMEHHPLVRHFAQAKDLN